MLKATAFVVFAAAAAMAVLAAVALGASAGRAGDFTAPIFFITPSPDKAPANTQPATLWDLQSAEFIQFYNSNGLYQDADIAGLSGCCIMQIREGFLTYRKSVTDFASAAYVAPYSAGGQHECAATLTGRVELGCAVEQGSFCSQTSFGQTLTSDIVARFAYTPTASASLGCGTNPAAFVIMKTVAPPPPFRVGAYGSTFTPGNGIPKGYKLATLAEIQSASFASAYNLRRLQYNAPGGMLGCCVVAINGGYLTTTDGDFASLYTSTGAFQCTEMPVSPIGLGSAYLVGSTPGVFWPQLPLSGGANLTVSATLSAQLNCGTPQDTFAIYSAV